MGTSYVFGRAVWSKFGLELHTVIRRNGRYWMIGRVLALADAAKMPLALRAKACSV